MARVLLIAAGLLLLVAIVYWPTHSYPFVNFDDPDCVYVNPHVVSGLTADNIRWAFTAYWVGHWAPLAWISYQFDATLFHLDPGAMHLENVALYATSTLLLFVLLKISAGKIWRSALVAAVFAVHPLHVESVAWISERRDMISGPPMLGSVIAYVWYTRAKNRSTAIAWYLFAVTLLVISLLGKAIAATLPVSLLLVDLWPLQRIVFAGSALRLRPRTGTRWSRLLLEKLPFLIISAAVSRAAVHAQAAVGAARALTVWPISARLENAVVCYVLYAGKFILPINLVVFYPLHPWPWLAVLSALIVLLLISGVILRSRRPYAVFGWGWFLIVLLPVIGFFQAGPQAMADRYMYLPIIGLAVIVVWGLGELRFKRWLVAGASFAILLLTIGAREQVSCRRSSRALFEHALRILNEGSELHIQLARLDVRDSDRAGAEREYALAARLSPDDFAPEYDRGNLLIDQPERAIPHYIRALHLRPHFAPIENNLAIAWINSGRSDLAAPLFQSAIYDDPGYAAPHANFGMLMLRGGQKTAAAREFAAAIRIDPANRIARSGIAELATARPPAP